jgi:hypothetical protein
MTHPPIELPRFDRKHRSWLQRRADHDLARHAYRVELVGRLAGLAWPSLCACCGSETDDRFIVRKVFVRPRQRTRTRRGFQRQVIATAHVPYCSTCIDRHRALTPPRSLLGDLWSMLWPVLIPMLGAAWFFQLTLRLAFAEPSRSRTALVFVWGLPALFGFILIWCVASEWSRSPRSPDPATTATT